MAYKGNLRYIIKHLLHIVDPSFRGLTIAFLILIMSALFFSFIAHGIEILLNYLIKDKLIYAFSLIGIGLLIYVILAIFYVYQTKKYKGLDYEIKEICKLSDEEERLLPYKVLILFVSIPQRGSESEEFLKKVKDPQTREALIKDRSNPANWIIPLVLLIKISKFAQLKKLCLIFSQESYKHRDRFIELVNACVNNVTIIERVIDFFNLEELQRELLKLIEELKEHIDEEEILLDITAGAVPPSIIGASLTYRRNITISYVRTNDRTIQIFNISEVKQEH